MKSKNLLLVTKIIDLFAIVSWKLKNLIFSI